MAAQWQCPDDLSELRVDRERRAAGWFLLGSMLGALLAWGMSR